MANKGSPKGKKRKREMTEFEKQSLLFNWIQLIITTVISLLTLYLMYKGL